MNTEPSGLTSGLNRRLIVGWGLSCVLVLTLLSLLANVMWIERWPAGGMALALFSVDREMSLATWWSSLVLAGLGVLTWLIYRQRGAMSRTDRLAWYALAGGFVFLSADEACMIHERIGGKIKLQGVLHHARWLLLWLPLGGVLSGLVLWRLWRSSRYLVIGLTFGIVVFLVGAAGVEVFNAGHRYRTEQKQTTVPVNAEPGQPFVPSDWRRDRSYYRYVAGTSVEELLEMLAPIIWLWVLLDTRCVSGGAPTGGPRGAKSAGTAP